MKARVSGLRKISIVQVKTYHLNLDFNVNMFNHRSKITFLYEARCAAFETSLINNLRYNMSANSCVE